jgi:Protein of unknown function (DUF3631)
MVPGTEQSRIVGRISSGCSAVITVMAVVTPRAADSDHVVEFAPKFLARFCDVLEPVLQIRRGVEAAEIEISRPVSEPAPHLHQRVTHAAGPQEVADAQTFQWRSAKMANSTGVALLADVRTIFAQRCVDRMRTAELVDALVAAPANVELVHRFQSSNHIRRLDRVCKTTCGRPGPD